MHYWNFRSSEKSQKIWSSENKNFDEVKNDNFDQVKYDNFDQVKFGLTTPCPFLSFKGHALKAYLHTKSNILVT